MLGRCLLEAGASRALLRTDAGRRSIRRTGTTSRPASTVPGFSSQALTSDVSGLDTELDAGGSEWPRFCRTWVPTVGQEDGLPQRAPGDWRDNS